MNTSPVIYLTTHEKPTLHIKPPESLIPDHTGFARIEMTNDQLASFVISAIDWLLARKRGEG